MYFKAHSREKCHRGWFLQSETTYGVIFKETSCVDGFCPKNIVKLGGKTSLYMRIQVEKVQDILGRRR